MRAAPPGRRPSNKPVAKFRGDKLVDGVTHNPHGRTDEEEAAYILADPVAAARERAIFEAELAEEARKEEEQKLMLQRAAAAKQEKKAAADAAAAAQEAQKREVEATKQAEAAKQAEAERRAEAARVVDARLAAEKAEAAAAAQTEAARRAEAARVVDARIAAEKAEAEAAVQAEAEAAEELRAQEALQERISAEKARREKVRQEEAERAQAEAEADRAAAKAEAAAEAARARAALAAANEGDTEELREKRRLAEEKRRKRAAFLDDMDGFSTEFVAHNEKTAQQNKEQLAQTEAQLALHLANQASGFVPVESKYVPEEKKVPGPLPARTPTVFPAAEKPKEELRVEEEDRSGQVYKLGAGSSETFDSTANSLFSVKDYSAGERAEAAKKAMFMDDEPLSAPRRVGSGKTKVSGRAAPLVESSTVFLKPNVPVGRIGAKREDAVVPALNKYDTPKVAEKSAVARSTSPTDQYTEEEGFGTDDSISNVLTREERAKLTSAQKVQWIAKQDDLGKRRKGFHGAVTYAFDGIFSWQMYGSAEAVDESGSTYTEYLMRCQWGTSWENLQPWISARRYREFDVLDAELRRMFPNYERAMPQLPGKDFFRFLEADVIDKRRQTLENYMSRIVLHLPTILRSRTISEFLGIQERLSTIKEQFAVAPKTQVPQPMPSGQSGNVAQTLVDKDDADASSSAVAPAAASSSAFAADALGSQQLGEEAFIKTPDQAEQRRKDLGYSALSEDELNLFEDELRKLILGLQGHSSTKRIKKTSAGYTNLVKLTTMWPQLRATCEVENADTRSFTLIPRALQAEEDLIRLIRDFENLTATSDHLSVLGI